MGPIVRGTKYRTWVAVAGLTSTLLVQQARAAGVNVGFQQHMVTIAPGDTFQVQIVVHPAGDPFNAFDAPIRFDPAWLTFVPTTPVADQRGPLMTSACSSTFHLFNARADSLQITLGLLCGQVTVTGPGTVYRVKFRASATEGTTTLTLGPSTSFFNEGLRVRPLVKRDLIVQIGSPLDVPVTPAPGDVRLETPRPNPSRGGAGVVTFELRRADEVRLDFLDTQGRRVASLVAGRFPPGRHQLPVSLAAPPGVYRARLVTGSGIQAERTWTVLR